MKITKFFAFFVALGALFTACNNDEFDGPVVPGSTEKATLTIKLADGSGSLRAADDSEILDGERVIEAVEFYIFESTGVRDAKYGYIKFLPTEDYTFAVSSGEKKIVAVANMNLGEQAGISLQDLTKLVYDKALTTPTDVPFTGGIPMSGQSASFSISAEEVKSVGVTVSRLFSRFNAPTDKDVTVGLTNQADLDSLATLLEITNITDPTKIKFELKEYIVVNGLKKSYVLPNYGAAESAAWDKNVWQLSVIENYTASQYNAAGTLGKVYSGEEFLGDDQVVYLYENKPFLTELNNIIGFDPATIYAMIVKADLSYEGKSVERYWRINVEKQDDDDQAYKILRNAIYKVNIDNVKTIGHGTPQDAEEEKPIIPIGEDAAVEITVDIADWRVFTSGVEI